MRIEALPVARSIDLPPYSPCAPLKEWLYPLQVLCDAGIPCVLATIVATRGSTPRETGVRMIVTRDVSLGTIGGGALEYDVVATARQMLADGSTHARWRRLVLGAGLAQCCGGTVKLLMEPVIPGCADWIAPLMRIVRDEPCVVVRRLAEIERCPAERALVSRTSSWSSLSSPDLQRDEEHRARARMIVPGRMSTKTVRSNVESAEGLLLETIKPSELRVVLFGAGHVSKALVHVLKDVPCELQWVESRTDQFPTPAPDGCHLLLTDTPEAAVDQAPSGATFIVMTHSHPLDLAICARALLRGDFLFLGLIGSQSKHARFTRRLRALGISEERLRHLTCPIGSVGINSKHPAFIAIAIAAEILRVVTAPATGSGAARHIAQSAVAAG